MIPGAGGEAKSPTRSALQTWLERFLGKQSYLLARHFLNRYMETDVADADGDSSLTAANILVILGLPGLIYTIGLLPKYSFGAGAYGSAGYNAASLPDKFLFITLTMVVIGLFTILRWDTLFPDRFDFFALTPLPIPPSRIFWTKTLSLGVMISILALDINVAPSIVYPCIVFWKGSLADAARMVGAHFVTVMAASLYVFLSLLAIHGTLLSLLGHRFYRWVSPFVQFGLLVWVGQQFVLVPKLKELLQHDRGGAVLALSPALWFIGLYQTLLGDTDPQFHALARQAASSLGYAIAVACVAYSVGYSRHLRRTLEDKQDHARASWKPIRGAGAAINHLLLREPQERASFHFIWQTVIRNPMHRLFLMAYAGVGVAVVVESLAALMAGTGENAPRDVTVALYSLPLSLSFLLLTGFRLIFTLPVEIGANWVFRLTGDQRPDLVLAGVRKAVLAIIVIPMPIAVAATFAHRWGLRAALEQALYVGILSWILMEVLLWGFARVPFTYVRGSGSINLPIVVSLFLVAFILYARALALLEYWLMLAPWRMLGFLAAAAIVLAIWSGFRNRYLATSVRLTFEDRPDPVVRTLGIG